MRIIGGKLRGSSLYIPKDKSTRPLKDITKESIFNLLTHSSKISFQFEASNILDLYSGTGSFGLECLSRKVQNVYFIEKEKKVISILKKNIEKLKLTTKTKIMVGDVYNVIEKEEFSELKFELIFCDPPFKNLDMEKLIKLILNKNLLSKNGTIILHRNKSTKEKFPERFKIVEERTYGISKIIFAKLLS